MSRSICIPLVLLVLGVSALICAEPGSAVRAKTLSSVPKELLEKRLDAARNVFRLNLQRLKTGDVVCDAGFLLWSDHWLNAELALSDNRDARIAAFTAHLERAKELEKITTTYAKTGQGREADAQGASYYRIDAEIRLQQAGKE